MSNNDNCEIYSFDKNVVEDTKNKIAQENIKDVSAIFKILADENRSKIAYALSHAGKLCVCDLANILDISVANTSHHLRSMYNLGVVKFEKIGKLAFYELDDDHIKDLLEITLNHVNEVKEDEK